MANGPTLITFTAVSVILARRARHGFSAIGVRVMPGAMPCVILNQAILPVCPVIFLLSRWCCPCLVARVLAAARGKDASVGMVTN